MKVTYPKWRAGDLFFMPQWPSRIYKIHRVHGTQISYLGSQYGTTPPRGVIRHAHAASSVSWVKVERDYSMPRNATTYQFTHTARRLDRRDTCEKCGTETNWTVMTCGRLAYWCGCGN